MFGIVWLVLVLVFSLLFIVCNLIFNHKKDQDSTASNDLYNSIIYCIVLFGFVLSAVIFLVYPHCEISDHAYIKYKHYKNDSTELYEKLKHVAENPEPYFRNYQQDVKITNSEFSKTKKILLDLKKLKKAEESRSANIQDKVIVNTIKSNFQ